VSYGAHHPERLMKYQPLACIDRFSDVGSVVEKYKKQIDIEVT